MATTDVEMNGAGPAPGTLSEDDKRQIIRQVEFYFSDANLPLDRFMFLATTPYLDANKAPNLSDEAKAKAQELGPGCSPIALQIICSFKRMRPFSSIHSLSTLAGVIQNSPTDPKLVDVYKEGEGDALKWLIRRVKPLEASTRSGAAERSVYVKGFLPEAADGQEEPVEPEGMQETLEKWADQWGKVAALRMRRVDPKKSKPSEKAAESKSQDNSAKWKNSIFIEFHSLEDAKALVEAGQKEQGKPTFEGREVAIESKVDYVTRKAKEKGLPVPDMSGNKSAANGTPQHPPSQKQLKSQANAPFNAFREMQQVASGLKTYAGESVSDKKLKDAAKKAAEVEAAKPITFDYEGKTYEVEKTKEGSKLKEGQEIEFREGLVLNLELKGDVPKDAKEARLDFKTLKASLGEAVGTACVFVNCPPPSTTGKVGFADPVSDEGLEKIKAANMKGGGRDVEFTRPSKEEEHAFHLDRIDFKASQATEGNDRSGKGKGGRGGGRGGSRGGGKFGNRGGARAATKSTPTKAAPQSKKRDAEGNIVGGPAANGDSVPEIGSTSKKAKTEEASSSASNGAHVTAMET